MKSRRTNFKTCGQSSKTFQGRNLRFFVIIQSVCLWQSFQPSVMFEGQAGAYLSEAPERIERLAKGTMLHSGRLWPYTQTLDQAGKLARDKHCSLLRKTVNCGCKKFYKISPCGLICKTFYGCNKFSIVISWSVGHCQFLPPLPDIFRQGWSQSKGRLMAFTQKLD